jgi:Protein of unknown function (DUF2490)
MHTGIKYNIIFLVLVLVTNALRAQYKDAGLWAEGTLSKEWGKRWECAVVPELRMDENITRVSRAFTDIGAQYKINKWLQSALVYRVGLAENDGYYDLRHRIQLGLALKTKRQDFSWTYAPRWQLALSAAQSDDADIATTLRNRFQMKYNGWKDWELAMSYEFFHSTSAYRFLEWQNWRWISQVSYELNKSRSISAGYLIQRKLTGSQQQLDYVVLVGYKYNFKNKKSKKKQGPGKTGKEAP